MLKAHMNAVENHLLQISKIPANTGHTLHKGTPREAFIKEFLEQHLSANVAIGTGEIIDCNSVPRGSRNQFDIVIYKRTCPKLDFGGGISGFLVESVIATIEVKSLLDQAAIDQSVIAASNVKSLSPHINQIFKAGWAPIKPLSFVVAYDGPAQMTTAHGWIVNTHQNNSIPFPVWNQANRIQVPGTALDGVVVLGKGFIKLNNTPLTINNPLNPALGIHIVSDSMDGNLLTFFLSLQEACNSVQAATLDPGPYLANVQLPNIKII